MSKTRRIDYARPPVALPPWRQRWAVIACAIVFLLVLMAVLAASSWGIVLDRLIGDGFYVILWLAAAGGFGSLVPLQSHPLRVVTTIALGIGIIGLLQLFLGLSGQLQRWNAFAIIGVGMALLIWRARRLTIPRMSQWFTAPVGVDWLWLLAMPVLTMTLIAAFAPPGILWGDEPHGYDVLEYHLQLPREWYELNRIVPLEHNVFSYFPLGVEMHYLLAMQLRGGPWAGMYLAQLMHATFIVLAVVSVYAAARLFADELRATLAAVAAANVPWLALLAPVAYNEGGVLLFGTLSIAWCLQSRSWIIAGVFAGFACGTKLTAVPQLLVLVPMLSVVLLRARLAQAATFVLAGLLVFSPWLIRNMAWAGNPVFPEGQAILGHAHFSPDQSMRWSKAHHPHHAIGQRVGASIEQIILDRRYAWLLIPAGTAGALFAIRRREARIILSLLLAWLIFWIGLTHLQSRFYVLAIPIAALGIAMLPSRIALATILAIVSIGLYVTAQSFMQKVGPLATNQVLGIESFKGALPQETEGIIYSSDKPIALVGDAKAFLYEIPTSRLHYRTVFDVDVQPGESLIDAWARGAPESARRIIDQIELNRFARTYYGIPPVTTQPAGN